jgi:hexosaminidase
VKLSKYVKIFIWFILVCLFPFSATNSAEFVALIPQPVSLDVGDGVFEVGPATGVVASGPAKAEANKLIEALAPAMGFRLKLAEGGTEKNAIVLSLDAGLKEQLGTEGYKLNVTPKRIDIRAVEPAGLFYGGETVRQLLPAEIYRPAKVKGLQWSVPCVKITDYPRFGWRGLLIDPARHFIPKQDMLRFIDVMATHKFNRLQVHFTDSQGWRIEIKKYPKLTEVGSRWDYSRRKTKDGQYVGGYYTQDDIREIVRYAANRHITMVPEIEMPYHTGAAIVAYPELGINTGHLAELPPEQRWGKTKGLIAPRPETVAFLQDVLTEVIELFPSQYIHIGGDEANIGHWAGDPEMQAQIKRLKLKDAHELHSWFIKQMDAFLTTKGRQLVGWDEILQGGLAPGATVMSWRGTSGGITAARAGHDVVMAPTSHTYFDYRQAPDETGLGRSVINLQKVYAFEPIPAELNVEQAKHVLGGQGQLWGELISDYKRREFMAFPRACALSEVLWSPKDNRSFRQFVFRLLEHRKRLKAAGINYRPLDTSLIESAAGSARNIDYFTNNWNIVGLKDYKHGSGITPGNNLVVTGKIPVEVQISTNRKPLSRANPNPATDG